MPDDLTEETTAALLRFMESYVAGTATRTQGLHMLVQVGREVDSVCREFGDDSERCTNVKLAYTELAKIVAELPVKAPSCHSTGSMILVGVLSAGAGVGIGLLVG